MTVLIVVTHLLGTGHLARALTLAKAFRQAGHDVLVASGGMPAPQLNPGDVTLVQLPPLRSDGVNFTRLLDQNGAPATEDLRTRRSALLLAELDRFKPDVIITELFPFGRRILRDEFSVVLNAARQQPHRPLICASIRDILAPPSTPQKAARTDAIVSAYYDAVLVHSDPSITPLTLSWPVSDTLSARLHYTGFVAPPPAVPHPDKPGAGEIIVSAGGGDVGDTLFQTALTAAARSPRRWRLLVGGQDSATQIAALAPIAPPNVTIEPPRHDFRQMLHHAAASISMCGYNTALDLLQSGCRAVLVPFDKGREVEQTLRAKALALHPGMAVLHTAKLSADSLLNHLDIVLDGPARAPLQSGFEGATTTVQIVAHLRKRMT